MVLFHAFDDMVQLGIVINIIDFEQVVVSILLFKFVRYE